MSEIERAFVGELLNRLEAPSPLIQVVVGPRQVGKTTGVKQLLKKLTTPSVYASADKTISTSTSWIREKWQDAYTKGSGTTLVIDEVQKIENWPEVIKALWDTNSKKHQINLVLLGSSALQLQKGLTESMAGRFEIMRVYHWSYQEFCKAFKTTLDEYLLFGGYPGAYRFVSDGERWLNYIKNSIIESVIGQDILSIRSVSKPALFRQAFEILSSYPAQEISYTKLLGQLQDKGNTDLIKSYINLYENAYLFTILEKYSSKPIKKKSSSPQILPMCPALHTAQRGHTEALSSDTRGRLFELIVGTDLIRDNINTFYWRSGNYEVDYLLEIGEQIFALEVKSGRLQKMSGLEKFLKEFPDSHPVIITPENYEEFSANPKLWLRSLLK